jgi:uncharacterized protein (TIGR02598 family)
MTMSITPITQATRELWRRQRVRSAFSLVEVTLAVGIVSVVIAVLLGLIPLGFQASREAADYSMASTIATDILSTFQAEGAASFTNASLARFNAVPGAATTTIYYAGPSGGIGTYSSHDGTCTGTAFVNLQEPWKDSRYQTGAPSLGSTGSFLLFFDALGQQTTNVGTTTTLVGALARRPYFRAEITILTSASMSIPYYLTPANLGTVSQVTVTMRWPCLSNPGTNCGWRPRRGGPRTTGTFTDTSVSYTTEVTQIR